MYKSWDSLLVSDEVELRSLERIKKVHRSRSSFSFLIIAGFFLSGLASILLSGLLINIQAYFWSFAMLLLAASFFWGMKLFYQARAIEPIRNFLINPNQFEFTTGEFTSATYAFNEKGSNRKIIVKGEAKSLQGKSLVFVEFFHPSVWPFIESGSEKNLRPGDDWYDLKGKRQVLPIEVFVLYHKETMGCSLIGIDRVLLEKSLKIIKS